MIRSSCGEGTALRYFDEMVKDAESRSLDITTKPNLLWTQADKQTLRELQHVIFGAKFTRAYLEVLYDAYGKVKNFTVDQVRCIYEEAMSWPYDERYACAKFCTAWPMARCLRNETPPNPCGVHPCFKGAIKRFLKNRLISKGNKTSRRFFWGVLQGVKRACAEASEDFIGVALRKHRDTVSGQDLGEITETHRELYGRLTLGFVHSQPRMEEPSPGACVYIDKETQNLVSVGRNDGGNRGNIRRIAALQMGVTCDIPGLYRELAAMVEVRPGDVREIYDQFPHMTLADWESEALDERPIVMAHPIPEPLKVRVITKGQSVTQTYSRSLQRDLFDHLRKFPQFALIGEPIDEEHLWWMLGKTREGGFPFKDFVSGDYSSATDGISFKHTSEVLEAFLHMPCQGRLFGLGEVRKHIFRQAIALSEVHYPESKVYGSIDPVQQSTGQLMGSVLSFPILCMINLVGYWMAINRWLDAHQLPLIYDPKDLPVLINGDDILFMSDPELYSYWKEEIMNLNLKLSIGKNYYHRSVLTVNSEMYTYTFLEGFVRVPYLNVGLLTGQSKISGREKAATAPVEDYYNLTIGGAINKARAHRRFIHYHKAEIIRQTDSGRYSLFAPRVLGGLGFKKVPGVEEPYFTIFQRRLASQLLKRGTQPYTGDDSPYKIVGTGRSPAIMKIRDASRMFFAKETEFRDEDRPFKQPFGSTCVSDGTEKKETYDYENQEMVQLRRFKGFFPPPIEEEKVLEFDLVPEGIWRARVQPIGHTRPPRKQPEIPSWARPSWL
jgi:hypothetical protein